MQSRAAKQREIASRTASGKGGDTSPRNRSTEKRSLSSERQNQHSKQWERKCEGPGPGLHLGEQAGRHVVLMEEDRRLDMHSRAMWSSFTSLGGTQVDLRCVAGTLVGSEQGLWQLWRNQTDKNEHSRHRGAARSGVKSPVSLTRSLEKRSFYGGERQGAASSCPPSPASSPRNRHRALQKHSGPSPTHRPHAGLWSLS